MFYQAEKFNKNISNWNTGNVTEHSDMFEECPIKENFKPTFRD
jgi:surface protein